MRILFSGIVVTISVLSCLSWLLLAVFVFIANFYDFLIILGFNLFLYIIFALTIYLEGKYYANN